MSKTFRPWTIGQPLLLPPSVQDFVGEDHLARFVLALVLEHLDLGEIEGAYASERGQPPFDPAMMTGLLLYAYCNGVYLSRRIAKAARERVDFMSIVGLDPPDFRTVSDFRKRHLKALARLFGQVLKLCEQAGLAKLGHVALDGTKIKANASKHKAMSYERMEKRAAEGFVRATAGRLRWAQQAQTQAAIRPRVLHSANARSRAVSDQPTALRQARRSFPSARVHSTQHDRVLRRRVRGCGPGVSFERVPKVRPSRTGRVRGAGRRGAIDPRSRLDKGGRKEGERQSHADRALGLALARGERFDGLIGIRRQLLQPPMGVAKRVDENLRPG